MDSDKKKLADQFIQKHLSEKGVMAHGLLHKGSTVASTIPWSLHSHYKFGFNGSYFNERLGPHCLYNVDYGTLSRPPQDLESELILALRQVSDIFGRFAIPDTGSLISGVYLSLAKKAGVSYSLVPVPFSSPEFDAYREEFSSKNNIGDLEVIWKSYPEKFTDLPILYEARPLRLIDHNYDVVNERRAGVWNWGIYEMEKNTCIHRHLQRESKSGVPNIFVWSPELMAAQLRHPLWLQEMKGGKTSQSNANAEFEILHTLKEESLPVAESPMSFYKDRLIEINKELRWKRWGITNDASNYPLVRLIKKWSLDYPINLKEYEEMHGTVF